MDSAFDPTDVSWTRVSPRLASLRRVLLLVPALLGLALVALLWYALDARLPALLVLAALVGLLAWGWWAVPRSVAAWGYTERDQDLLVRRGLVFRQLVVVPYGRMQFVDVHAGPLDRAFGLARVQLHTAAASTDASIPGLVPEEAARLRDRLAARGEAQTAGL